MRYAISRLTFAALLMAAPLRAEVPFLFPVSGVLSDMDDVPLNGDHEVVFALYSARTGGTLLGGETQAVTFTNGLFQAYIGQETSGGLNVTPFIQTDEIWLGIKVGSDSEMSRVRLAAVPWAFEAFQCEQVTNLTTAGIQAAIPAGACGANAAMRGWSGGSAQCVTLPDTSSFVTHGDIGTAVQAPISQLQPCDHGVEEIDANGTVTCRAASAVVAACGVGAAGGSGDNYLGSDGVCHPAPHACTAGQYLDGNGTCVAMSVSGTANHLAMFTNGTSVGNSIVTQTGTEVGIAGDLRVSNIRSGHIMHLATENGQLIYLLANGHTVVSKAWGGSGNLYVEGGTTVNDYLVVPGSTQLAGTTASNLTVTGNATVNGTLTAGYLRQECAGDWAMMHCTCPEGTRVVGGGGVCGAGSFLSQSYPNPDLRTWHVHCHTTFDHAHNSPPVNIFAICARIN